MPWFGGIDWWYKEEGIEKNQLAHGRS